MNTFFVIDNQQRNGHFLDVATVDFSTAVGLSCTELSEDTCEARFLCRDIGWVIASERKRAR